MAMWASRSNSSFTRIRTIKAIIGTSHHKQMCLNVKTGWGSVCRVGTLDRVVDMFLESYLPMDRSLRRRPRARSRTQLHAIACTRFLFLTLNIQGGLLGYVFISIHHSNNLTLVECNLTQIINSSINIIGNAGLKQHTLVHARAWVVEVVTNTTRLRTPSPPTPTNSVKVLSLVLELHLNQNQPK